MKIEHDDRGTIVILTPKGNMVGGPDDANAFDKAIDAALERGKNRVIVDMSHVTIMSSKGLGILIVNHTRLSRDGGGLKVLHPSKRIRNVLMMTQLITVFDAYEDEDEALRAFDD